MFEMGFNYYGHQVLTAYPTSKEGMMIVQYRVAEIIPLDSARRVRKCVSEDSLLDIYEDAIVTKPKELAKYDTELGEWFNFVEGHSARPHSVMVVMTMASELRSIPLLALANRLHYSGEQNKGHGAMMYPLPTDIPLRDRKFAKRYLDDCAPENYEVIQAARAKGVTTVRPILDEMFRAKKKFVDAWNLEGRLY